MVDSSDGFLEVSSADAALVSELESDPVFVTDIEFIFGALSFDSGKKYESN